jgi:ferredoxin, 2Fe-2S
VPTVIAIDREGETHRIEGEVGDTLMSVLKYEGGLDVAADCGGFALCGTCHVYVEDSWRDRLPPLSQAEEMVLEGLLHRQASSRLACQNELTEALDGLIVTLAEPE